MKILTAAEVREVDRLSSQDYGIPSLLLMENAGMRVVETLEARFEDLESKTIGIICGKGNNGGDGFVVARQLLQKGHEPLVFLIGIESDVRGDAKTSLDILNAIGYPPTVVDSVDAWAEASAELMAADIIVDALAGTGLTRPADGLYREVIDTINERLVRATVVSIDVPSGLDADNAIPSGPAVQAGITVTFTALKPCLVLPPACMNAGDVIVADIGNPPALVDVDAHRFCWIEPDVFPEAGHRRTEDTHKGTYGKVLIVGGSLGKSGAVAMSGQAALRAGAGLVTLAIPASVLPMVAAAMPELMTEALPETAAGTVAGGSIAALFAGKTVLALGPGLSADRETQGFIRTALQECPLPAVIDADGLNAFVEAPGELKGTDQRPVIITPHPGEMARLIRKDIEFVAANRIDVAREFAAKHGVYVVLKGFRTVVAVPDGRVFINSTGNPGMATAGTGDILSGMIAGMLGQEMLGTLEERLCLAVYLHGAAGDLAAEEIGEESMVATDILRFLGKAWGQLRQ